MVSNQKLTAPIHPHRSGFKVLRRLGDLSIKGPNRGTQEK